MGFQMSLPYASKSDTSREAAESMIDKAPALRLKVFEYIKAQGKQGATCDEVERALGMKHQTASARVNELMQSKAIIDSTFRRKTSSGRNATIWIAAT